MAALALRNEELKNQANKFTAGRYLQCKYHGRGDDYNTLLYAESKKNWSDQRQLISACKSVVSPMTAVESANALWPLQNSFLGRLYPFSIPMQLAQFLRQVPLLTRIFVNAQGIAGAEVLEGQPAPILQGDWSVVNLTPRKFIGQVAQTSELMESKSPEAALAITDDLAQATAAAENLAFIGAETPQSVFNGAPSFTASGSSLADNIADIRQLAGLVRNAYRPGSVFVTTQHNSTYLGTQQGTSGAPAFLGLGPQGGTLLGIPLLVSSACELAGSPETHMFGLLSPSEIFYAVDDNQIELDISLHATMQMSDSPSAAPSSQVSMFQTGSAVCRATKRSAWYARPGAAAFFITSY